MKTVLIVTALFGLAFGASISTAPKATSTLPEAMEVIAGSFNITAMNEIVAWYMTNDDEVIALIDSLGSENFIKLVHLLDKQPELYEHIRWMDDHGIPMIEVVRQLNDIFEWGLILPGALKRGATTKS